MKLDSPDQDWEVRTEGTTVVVELPTDLELDEKTGKQINEAFAEAVGKAHTDTVLTLLWVDNPMSSGLFEEIKRGAELAAENGIDRWAVTVEKKIKGMAFESSLDGLDTTVFEDEDAARDWLR